MISNSDDVISWSGYALEKKMQRLPDELLFREFFNAFNILILILIVLCIDFVLLLKVQILKTFRKKAWFWKKGMHSYVSNVGVNRNSSIQLKTAFLLAFKETGSASDIY